MTTCHDVGGTGKHMNWSAFLALPGSPTGEISLSEAESHCNFKSGAVIPVSVAPPAANYAFYSFASSNRDRFSLEPMDSGI